MLEARTHPVPAKKAPIALGAGASGRASRALRVPKALIRTDAAVDGPATTTPSRETGRGGPATRAGPATRKELASADALLRACVTDGSSVSVVRAERGLIGVVQHGSRRAMSMGSADMRRSKVERGLSSEKRVVSALGFASPQIVEMVQNGDRLTAKQRKQVEQASKPWKAIKNFTKQAVNYVKKKRNNSNE